MAEAAATEIREQKRHTVRHLVLGQLMLAMQPLPPGGAMINYEGPGR
jgi:hypothetical protein